MLNDFFKLNPQFVTFTEEEELMAQIRPDTSVRNVVYQPDRLAPEPQRSVFQNVEFENVSFSKTKIVGVIFRNCVFKDCLFMSTAFEDCEFHRCTFTGCNPLKITFRNTYIDPKVFEGMVDPKEYSNIGVHLFQQLLRNAAETHQPEFAQTAEFNYKKWKRHLLNYERKAENLKIKPYLREWVPNMLFYVLAGYGIRAKFFIAWATVAFVLIFVTNFILWKQLGIPSEVAPNASRAIGVAYFSVVTLTTMGFGNNPPSSTGMLIVALEAITGLVMLSSLAMILVKKLIR